jgi:hypothetical protein
MATKTLVAYKAEGIATPNAFEINSTNGTTALLLDGKQVLTAQQAAIADLGQTISATYDQTQVQAISSKVDSILAMLRTQGLISS